MEFAKCEQQLLLYVNRCLFRAEGRLILNKIKGEVSSAAKAKTFRGACAGGWSSKSDGGGELLSTHTPGREGGWKNGNRKETSL